LAVPWFFRGLALGLVLGHSTRRRRARAAAMPSPAALPWPCAPGPWRAKARCWIARPRLPMRVRRSR